MRRSWLPLVAALLALPGGVQAADLNGAKAFVEDLWDRYTGLGLPKPPPPAASPGAASKPTGAESYCRWLHTGIRFSTIGDCPAGAGTISRTEFEAAYDAATASPPATPSPPVKAQADPKPRAVVKRIEFWCYDAQHQFAYNTWGNGECPGSDQRISKAEYERILAEWRKRVARKEPPSLPSGKDAQGRKPENAIAAPFDFWCYDAQIKNAYATWGNGRCPGADRRITKEEYQRFQAEQRRREQQQEAPPAPSRSRQPAPATAATLVPLPSGTPLDPTPDLRRALWTLPRGFALDAPLEVQTTIFDDLVPNASSGAPPRMTVPKLPTNARRPVGSGSGFYVAPGWLVTNHHVVNGCLGLTIDGGEKVWRAAVVAVDRRGDLALLATTEPETGSARLRRTPVQLGEQLYAIGYPLFPVLMNLNMTPGIVSNERGINGSFETYAISAALHPGNSGGPILDASGSVIGVAQAYLVEAKDLGIAISAQMLQSFLANLGFGLPPPSPYSRVATVELAQSAGTFVRRILCLR